MRIDVHFTGGMRHFHNWEIADIGLLVFVKERASALASKVALLQSKRLYPSAGHVDDNDPAELMIGMGRLLPDRNVRSLMLKEEFVFSPTSRYGALIKNDEQYMKIDEYESALDLKVYYMLYNPWVVPARYMLPQASAPRLGRAGNGGIRVVPPQPLREHLNSRPKSYRPTFEDVRNAMNSLQLDDPWRIEKFVADELLRCRQGNLFDETKKNSIDALFNRRSGPIGAAIAVTIERIELDRRN